MNTDETKTDSEQDVVIFSVLRPSVCSECAAVLEKGSLLRMQKEKPYCMECADLAHLVFLPSGNAALTRRSRKYSPLSAVVVRFSRARGRYERQGLLVERTALERAESECFNDEDARRMKRERAAIYREKVDARYIQEFALHLRRQFPGCPEQEAEAIALRACEKYSGRVGRSAFAKDFDESAIELAVRAHVRHIHTDYDRLLSRGLDRDEARGEIAEAVARVMDRWRNEVAVAEGRPSVGANALN